MEVWLQIMLISLGMVALGLAFNYIFGLTGSKMKEMRTKAKNLQERLKNAQMIGDPQMMQEVQREAMALTKDMMKRQFIPMCIRCFLFIGIFIGLSFIYSDYGYDSGLLPFNIPLIGSGWFALYFLFSLAFSLIFYLIKFIYQKITGKEKASVTKEMMQMLSPNSEESSGEGIIQYDNMINSKNLEIEKTESESTSNKEIENKKTDSWKERLE
jgi:hypothetical protein